MDAIIDSLKDMIYEVDKNQNIQLEILKNDVQFIIDNNITNENKIENTFDKLLDLTYWFGNKTESIYNSVLFYYEKINKQAVNDYKKFYLEIINEC